MEKVAHDVPSIGKSLWAVRLHLREAAARRAKVFGTSSADVPTLVAVSKTKPRVAVHQAYDFGQRHFGESYVQELVQKATRLHNEGLNEIQWHFIGQLQRNKANMLCKTPNLFMVQTVDSVDLADALDKAWQRNETPNLLRVMVQVNTSREHSKNGCAPHQCTNLVEHLLGKCPHLHFTGLMTIGAPAQEHNFGANADFQGLVDCKQHVIDSLAMADESVKLSMGMSDDYEEATEYGSDFVRIGSLIFGTRSRL